MRLLSGPAGSGKTSLILDECRALLRQGDPRACLLVPTATMAQHLRNQLAREGFVLRNGLVQTMHSFIEPWAQDVGQASKAVLYLLVEKAAERVAPKEFEAVAGMPGFSAALARTMEEFSSAGCEAARLADHLPDSPLAPAFLSIYQEVEKELAKRKLATRGKRLETAAARIGLGGPGEIRTVWLDGFHALPDPELSVIEALNRHATVTLALNPEECSAALAHRLASIGVAGHPMPRKRVRPALLAIEAANIEREVEEIARRILQQAAAGRPFREIGVIVRSPETYAPILRATMERFAIPARFYFEEALEDCAPVRFLSRMLQAMFSGWDHAATLSAMRLAPRMANLSTFDRFDFQVREQIPNHGLDDLRALAGDSAPILATLSDFASLDKLRSARHSPYEWAGRLSALRNHYSLARLDEAPTQGDSVVYRTQAAALDAFDEAVSETALALPGAAITLEEFWRAVKSAIRIKGVRVPDRRRNVVQVMSAAEARQWVLPVVFVCGLVEKQFPQTHRQDAFFPDPARQFLNTNGIRVRTAAEFEREERALFESAISRATLLTALTYPAADARGEGVSVSTFLDALPAAHETARPVRPRAKFDPGPRAATVIQSANLLDYLKQNLKSLSPSGLETYFQCAFQFFGQRTLRLKRAPYRPDERFDFLLQGNIVHEVLATWYPEPGPIEPLFEAAFEKEREGKRIPENYHTERLRNAILDDLRAFTADPKFAPHGQKTETELQFALPLDESVSLKGRIDRIDTESDGTVIIYDYKYSPAASTKGKLDDGNLVQAPLYALAARTERGVAPAGVYYISLKGGSAKFGPRRYGWGPTVDNDTRPIPGNWMEDAQARVLEALARIREGLILAKPSNPSKCRFCDFRDVCRVAAAEVEEAAAGEGE